MMEVLGSVGGSTCRPSRIARMVRGAQSALQNGRDAHAAGGANGNEPALRLALVEQFRERGDDAGSGRGERVAERETAALDVELRAIDGAERARKSQFFPAE